MAVETNDDSEFMPIDPELEAIWNSTEDPSFNQLRNQAPEAEQPEDTEPDDSEDSTTDVDNTPEQEDTDLDPDADIVDDSVEKSKADTQPEDEVDNTVHKVKANGMDFEFTTDELIKLAPKAMDYTKKMQEIAPWRKTISAMKEQGIGEQDVNLMIDVLKGDKNAIAEVLKRTGVDALELDTDGKDAYLPNQYGKDEVLQEIEAIVAEISTDPEYVRTEAVVDKQWDSRSRQAMAQNPSMIRGLHADIKSGTYDKVAPMALKLKSLDHGTLSDLEYYMEAGRQYFAQASKAPAPAAQQRQEQQRDIKEMADKRKAAAPSKTGSGKRDVINYLDDNDEDFADWYKTLQARS